jgi:uncharacterized damage-inducible protein DinB
MSDLRISQLLDYLYWQRDRIASTAAALDADRFLDTPSLRRRDLRATLAHELDVEHSWRPKLRGEPTDAWGPTAEVKASEFPTLDALMNRWRFDEAEMRDWIGGLSAEDLAEPVTANNLDGRPLETYLLHVIEHGITEFTTAAAILGEMGHEVPELSFLNFLDDVDQGAQPGT